MPNILECDICLRPHSHKLPFYCPVDARNQLYELRLRHARVLLEKDGLDREISSLVTDDLRDTAGTDAEHGLQVPVRVTTNDSKAEAARDRTQQIIQKAEELRRSVEAAKADIASRKAVIQKGRQILEKTRNGLEARRNKQQDEVAKAIRLAKGRWNYCHAMTVQCRPYLCWQIGSLFALQRLKSEHSLVTEFAIGGVKMVDLRNMNTASPIQITTAFGHIAHLLSLASKYLQVRLPAQLTLPHNDYPQATIFSLSASHTLPPDITIPYPGTTPEVSGGGSPGRRRRPAPSPRLPRPRSLHITEPLPKLAKEDTEAYSSFIEGACLLAYDVAWVCRSQGIDISTPSTASTTSTRVTYANTTTPADVPGFADIAAIGRNMFALLIGEKAQPPPPTHVGLPTVSSEDSGKAKPALGQYSHGTVHTSLHSAAGTEVIQGFRLLSFAKLKDQLKNHLLQELAGAEWEMVDAEADLDDGRPVEVGAQQDGTSGNGPAPRRGNRVFTTVRDTTILGESFATLGTTYRGDAQESGKENGGHGWIRVRPRT
jgi:hypothetical protein